MTYFTIFHWMLTAVFIAMFIVAFFFALRLKGQIRLMALIVLTLVTIVTYGVGLISLDKRTKKAEIIKFHNKRVLRNETIVFTGYVVNTGSYKIGKSTLELKLINKGTATGRVKGEDFYQPNGFFANLFSFDSGGNVKKKQRPGTLTKEYVVARNLMPGERKKFKFRFKFPTYFQDINFRLKLNNH